MKKLLSIFLVLVLGATVSYADTHDADAVVGHENSLIIENDTAVGDPSEEAIVDAKIFDMKMSNNDFDGFVLTFSSANNGALRIGPADGSYSVSKKGTWVQYTLDFEPGTVLSDLSYTTLDPTTGIDLGDNTTPSDQTLTYTDPKSALNDGTVDVEMNISLTPDLFEGTFSDTITVTIADYTPEIVF